MAKVKYIPCDIYKRGIVVFIGSIEELKAWVKKEYTDDIEKDFVDMTLNISDEGEARFLYDNKQGQGVVHIYEMPLVPKDIAALEHELLHATFHILNFCRVDYFSDGNNEAFCYLLEHLTRNALEKDTYNEL